MLKQLLTAKDVSIYGIINEADKKVFFTYTIETKLMTSFTYHIRNFKEDLVSDKEKVVFKLIETYDKKNWIYLKWRVQELYNEYKNLGYTFYTAYKPLQWKLYVRIGTTSGDNQSKAYKAIVKLKTSANVVHDIKVFDTVEEATLFVQSNTISTVVRLV